MKSPANSAPHLHRWRNPPATPAVRLDPNITVADGPGGRRCGVLVQ